MGEVCDAILEFKYTPYFVMCELEKGHKDNHKAIMFEWEGEGISQCHNSYRLRGFQLLKIHAEKSIRGGGGE